MDAIVENHFKNLWIKDRTVQTAAYFAMIEITDTPITWAYEVWDELLGQLQDKDNHNRAIAAQILSNLAKSDPEKRMLEDFAALLQVTRDLRTVTARHCMQSLWKVGVSGIEQQKIYLDGLSQRFKEAVTEKNCTLTRFDIIQSLRNVYDSVKDESIRALALELIETEEDLKYRKKYAALWKK